MPDAPQLDSVTPASARAATTLTLAGTSFGARTDGSAVRLRVPAQGAAPVPGELVSWSATAIQVRVPPLATFGSGGPLEITVHSDDGDSDAAAFVLEEEAPPAVTAVQPARGLGGDAITLTGERFGRRAPGSAVLFQAPGPRDVAAVVDSWNPGTIVVRVPLAEALGGAGQRSLVVSAAWGRSDQQPFLLGELPRIEAVVPASPSPAGTITIQGRAFGPQAAGHLELVAVYATADPTAPGNTTVPAVLSWTDTEIQAQLPDLPGLRTTGPRDVVVTSEWGASRSDQHSRILIESRASITNWTRLEPHARTSDLQAGLQQGLQAQVYDALWLLGRQWQMLELHGTDAGSPVTARVDGTATPLARWRPRGGQPGDVPAGTPLEAVVERETVIPAPAPSGPTFSDLRLAAESGLHLLRLIEAELDDGPRSGDYRARFRNEYPLRRPSGGAALDAGSQRFLTVAAGRVPDGARIYADFQSVLDSPPRLPRRPPIDDRDRDEVISALRRWYAWCAGLISAPVGSTGSGWDRQRMEYSFTAGSGDVVLAAPEHDGGHLDWYSFVRRTPGAGVSLGSPRPDRRPVAFTRTAVPNGVSFPGMPVPRWWELEDRVVDFGAVAAEPSDLLKLVLVEFATVFGNDWFTVPLDAMPVGSLLTLGSVKVTDSFGVTSTLAPFGDGSGTDWRMFELTREDGTADAGNSMLLLDTLPTTAESDPIEDVVLLRDELANMAWAVEKTVESRTGRPVDRHEEEVTGRGDQPPVDQEALRRYLLQTAVPRNWIPLLPKFDRDTTGAVRRRWLARGAMRDPAGGPAIRPVGRLLEPGTALDIFDEEVPRAGARVRRLWTYGRSLDGRTHLWRGRRKGPGRGEGSSGLSFDSTRT
ncbi:IPT/TIG domain-containing protein [Actinoplanes sp. LDG1-06]|uniref:IPT/TIG domain-containing protein n=1 Tax=Paractinoplanes ovalisporus TaxID=2810368 RepID=A0ABS2AHK4_9ACTN|nr:IPT/TIG domain-containing protein [Actinoplanes ovalisporus]MBM2619321.1 IPT/TIG domain-containing protein [Actinoplanes ovalisporus]